MPFSQSDYPYSMSDIRHELGITLEKLRSFGEPYVFGEIEEKFLDMVQKLESLPPCCCNSYVNKGFLPLQRFVLKPPERILSCLTVLLCRYEGFERSDDGNDPKYSSESFCRVDDSSGGGNDVGRSTSPDSLSGGTSSDDENSVFDITDPQNEITWQRLTQDDNSKITGYEWDVDNDDKSRYSDLTNMSLERNATGSPGGFGHRRIQTPINQVSVYLCLHSVSLGAGRRKENRSGT